MLNSKRRLFRRRGSWLAENVHLIVTAFALLATAYVWTALSNTEPLPPIQVASAETSPVPTVEDLLLGEETPPAPTAEEPSASAAEPSAPPPAEPRPIQTAE